MKRSRSSSPSLDGENSSLAVKRHAHAPPSSLDTLDDDAAQVSMEIRDLEGKLNSVKVSVAGARRAAFIDAVLCADPKATSLRIDNTKISKEALDRLADYMNNHQEHSCGAKYMFDAKKMEGKTLDTTSFLPVDSWFTTRDALFVTPLSLSVLVELFAMSTYTSHIDLNNLVGARIHGMTKNSDVSVVLAENGIAEPSDEELEALVNELESFGVRFS